MGRRLRDVDTGDQGEKTRFVGLLVVFGLIPCYLLGSMVFPTLPTPLMVPAIILALMALGRALWPIIDHSSRGLITGISAASGDPYTFQYSEIEALVIRGAHAEAAERYREIAATADTEESHTFASATSSPRTSGTSTGHATPTPRRDAPVPRAPRRPGSPMP